MATDGGAGVGARDLWRIGAAAGALWLAWQLSAVLLLAFAAVLLALALRGGAAPLERRFGWSPGLAVAVVLLAGLAVLALFFWLAGSVAAEQIGELGTSLPRAWKALQQSLAHWPGGRWLLGLWQQAARSPADWQRWAGIAGGTLNVTFETVSGALLLLAIGVYLAADPELYRRGALALLPAARRPGAERLLARCGEALTSWLLGQGVVMIAVGLLASAGFALIGLPAALALGAIAGLLEFVPYVGPAVAALLVVGVGLADGVSAAAAAFAVGAAIQSTEAFVLQPLVQRWAVRQPPVLGLLAVLVFGTLFGLPGVLLAVPLMVLTQTIVRELQARRDRR